MRLFAFSDLHHARARADAIVGASIEADLVIGAGDFCNHREGLQEAMNLLGGITAPFVVVPGNAESHEELQGAAHLGTHVLHGTGVTLDGVSFFGLGYAVPETPFGDWSCDLSEAAAEQMLSACDAVDVLIVHSPPKGAVDRNSAGLSLGSTAIRAAIERIQPQIAVCGHIHDSWRQDAMIGQTRVVNLGPAGHWFDL